MVIVRLHRRIVKQGTSEVELPKGLPAGEVDITLSVTAVAQNQEPSSQYPRLSDCRSVSSAEADLVYP
jgi:hypothetical protein